MRKKLSIILEGQNRTTPLARAYDIAMIIIIIASIVPMAFKTGFKSLTVFEYIVTGIFIVDYVLRWITADISLKRGRLSFVIYPFTIMAIVDLLSILPTFIMISTSLKALRAIRLVRALKVIRVFKLFRYSRNVSIIVDVLKRQKGPLMAVGILAVGYIMLTALVIFNIEPDTFDTFFDAVYWATTSLTTVGYGDILTYSTAGRLITMISILCGIAIVVLPAGIITAGYLDVLRLEDEKAAMEKQANGNDK